MYHIWAVSYMLMTLMMDFNSIPHWEVIFVLLVNIAIVSNYVYDIREELSKIKERN